MFFALRYDLVTRFMFLLFVFFVFCVFVLFLLVYIVITVLFVCKFTDYCHRLETQLQLINITSLMPLHGGVSCVSMTLRAILALAWFLVGSSLLGGSKDRSQTK